MSYHLSWLSWANSQVVKRKRKIRRIGNKNACTGSETDAPDSSKIVPTLTAAASLIDRFQPANVPQQGIGHAYRIGEELDGLDDAFSPRTTELIAHLFQIT